MNASLMIRVMFVAVDILENRSGRVRVKSVVNIVA